MKFPYIVCYKDKWYEAGADVPVSTSVPKENIEVDKKGIDDMTIDELKALGKEHKIKGYHLMSEENLKKALIELGL